MTATRSTGQAARESFLIASPDGEIGVLALKPFAPDCTNQAKRDLKRLAKKSD